MIHITAKFFLQGLDVFLVYVVLRNQMRYLFRGKYDLDQPVDEMDHVMYQPANDVAKNIEMVS